MNSMFDDKFDEHLDMEGVSCPLPLLRTKQRLKAMESGKVLYVSTTDSASVKDFTAFISQTKHVLLKQGKDQTRFQFWIKKA